LLKFVAQEFHEIIKGDLWLSFLVFAWHPHTIQRTPYFLNRELLVSINYLNRSVCRFAIYGRLN
jgi:hypothetical protein